MTPASAFSSPETDPESRAFLRGDTLDETARLPAYLGQSGFDVLPDSDHPRSLPDHRTKSLERSNSFDAANTICETNFLARRKDQHKLSSAEAIDPPRSSVVFAATDSFFLVTGEGKGQQGIYHHVPCVLCMYLPVLSGSVHIARPSSAPVMSAAQGVAWSRVWGPLSSDEQTPLLLELQFLNQRPQDP